MRHLFEWILHRLSTVTFPITFAHVSRVTCHVSRVAWSYLEKIKNYIRIQQIHRHVMICFKRLNDNFQSQAFRGGPGGFPLPPLIFPMSKLGSFVPILSEKCYIDYRVAWFCENFTTEQSHGKDRLLLHAFCMLQLQSAHRAKWWKSWEQGVGRGAMVCRRRLQNSKMFRGSKLNY